MDVVPSRKLVLPTYSLPDWLQPGHAAVQALNRKKLRLEQAAKVWHCCTIHTNWDYSAIAFCITTVFGPGPWA